MAEDNVVLSQVSPSQPDESIACRHRSGVAKLLTCGGLGIWTLIDIVLIAMRTVPDSKGLPLK